MLCIFNCNEPYKEMKLSQDGAMKSAGECGFQPEYESAEDYCQVGEILGVKYILGNCILLGCTHIHDLVCLCVFTQLLTYMFILLVVKICSK